MDPNKLIQELRRISSEINISSDLSITLINLKSISSSLHQSGEVMNILKSLGINETPNKAFKKVIDKAYEDDSHTVIEWEKKAVELIKNAYKKVFSGRES